ncbi:MAG: hypothetical protein WCK67_00895 [bacterium]
MERIKRFESERKIKAEFCKIINTNPSSFYMHCLAGIDISNEMKNIFNEALAEGKILLPDEEL